MPKKWISVCQYAKLKGFRSPQVAYNHIATGKLKKGKEWREVEVKVKRKEVLYED